ncbi:substrate-binding periplasmic protein [Marinobacter sp. VGCF2001]|uniref:substrate-binding periplasmic protein n=1 Tax=Marinobacter sp. VGCF2001 TaxID=3417189 RepID=UPI003CFA7EEA
MSRFLVFAAALLMAACSPDDPVTPALNTQVDMEQHESPPTVPDSRRVILAADPWCPHNCTAGAPQEGYMVDIAREILAEAGYELEYRNYAWARSLTLARDQLISGVIGALQGDAPDMIFPDNALGTARVALYTRLGDPWQYQGMESLAGQTLLVLNGYSYSPDLDRYIAENAQDPDKVWTLSGPAPLGRALQLLEQGRADVFVEEQSVMEWFLRQQEIIPAPRMAVVVHRAPVFIAFAPDNPQSESLARLLDAGLARMTASGRREAIMGRYGLSLSD